MTERLSDVEQRIGSVHQLEAVVTAMRGIAASRAREAKSRLAGIRAYADTVGNAIGEALALLPASEAPANPRHGTEHHIVIALCSEQGFAGTFNERVLGTVERHIQAADGAPTDLLLAGDRGLMVAQERGLSVDWSAAMAAHAEEVPSLANRLADAVYERLSAGATQVAIVHAAPASGGPVEIVDRALVPLDFTRFPVSGRLVPPLITQDPRSLLAQLAEEYMFAELCEAVMVSFAAENDARMHAMIAARDNVGEKLDELTAVYRRLRQEEITNEIVELAAGANAEQESGFG
ncbi:F0F1 ATP synthase subunit gamma [Microbaculum sp. FT89]|uniref:F0F1 ATP synthase subunit gamma n=1 Tax=Microbaculum sp. FT89 TaxID=3447298 RepID=UPI003F53018E